MKFVLLPSLSVVLLRSSAGFQGVSRPARLQLFASLTPPFRLQPSSTALLTLTKGEEVSAMKPDDEPLTPDRVATLMERSFVEACIQLAQGYVDILKLFIVSTKAGYELMVNPTDLLKLVDKTPTQSAGRPLMEEEVELRQTWVQAIYLTLTHVDWKNITPGWHVDESISSLYGPLLPRLVQCKEEGQKFHTDSVLDEFPHLTVGGGVLERAIVAQTLRVMWTTLDVLQEEELAKPRSARPKIPGAFDGY